MKSILPALLLFFPVLAHTEALEPAPVSPATEFELAWIVIDPDTLRERLVTEARPEGGNEALHTVRFRYQGATNAEGLMIVAPVPDGRQYVPGSATGPGAGIEFSADGGLTYGTVPGLMVASDDSGEAHRIALPSDYTHVRWRLPGQFPPGVSGLVSFRSRPADEVQP